MKQNIESRVDSLEEIMKELARTQMRTEKELQEFKQEMKEFKDEMGAFKDEMRVFKDEMGAFKDEMRVFKDTIHQEVGRINRQWGELANKMGTLVEDIVAPNLPRIAAEYFGCVEIEDFMIRRKVRNKKDRAKVKEFDVLVLCGDKLIVNDTKSSPRVEYINQFIEVLEEIYDYFPEYKGKKLVPIFSSLYISEEIVKYLTQKGIYAMGMRDDTIEILNPDLAPKD